MVEIFDAIDTAKSGAKATKRSPKTSWWSSGLICNTETSHLTTRGETGSASSFDWTEPFTALGSVFFVRSKVMNTTDIWDFDNKRFIPLKRVTIEDHAGTFQTKLPFVHHGTFPKEYFVENPKWAATHPHGRKGFLHTRWRLTETSAPFDMINTHLFHDVDNTVAMAETPSCYATNRQRALEYTLRECELLWVPPYVEDVPGVVATSWRQRVSVFMCGDLNWRLGSGIHDYLDAQGAAAEVGEKCFELPIKADGIFRDARPGEPFGFDYEALLMPSRVQLHEMPVTFAPTYRLDETAHQASTSGTQARHYSSKRCPSWCDRIVMSPYARGRVPADGVEYGVIGADANMGDHKPVYIAFSLMPSADSARSEFDGHEVD